MKKTVLIVSVLLNVALVAALIYIGAYRTDYFKRLYAHIYHTPYVPTRRDHDCVTSWNNCIEKLDMQVDVVFFGDSHIAGGCFQSAFPQVRSINMGYIGEDTKGMLRRVEAIAAVCPKKIVFMGGINGLKSQSLDDFEYWYTVLVDSICSSVPDAKLYLNTLLPVTSHSNYCDNAKIVEANRIINRIASYKGLSMIDIHGAYAIDCAMPDNMSYDGLHLTLEAYEIWYKKIKSYIND